MVMTSVGKETRCGNFADQSSIAASVSICNVGDVVTVTYSLAANSAFNFIGNVSFSGGLSLQSGSTTLYFENLQGTPISNSLTFKVTGEGDQSVTLSGTMNSMQFFVDEFTPESLGVNKSCGFHVKTSAEIAAEQAAAAEAARQAEAARKAAEEKAAQEAAAQQAAAQEAARKAQEAAAKKASEDAVKASEEAEKEAEEAEKKASEEAEKASKEAEEETEKATLEAPASSNSKGSKSNKKGENEEDPNAESAIGGEEKLPEEEDALTEDESDLEDSEGDEEESEIPVFAQRRKTHKNTHDTSGVLLVFRQ